MKIFEAYAGKKWVYSSVAALHIHQQRYIFILEALSHFQSHSLSIILMKLFRETKKV